MSQNSMKDEIAALRAQVDDLGARYEQDSAQMKDDPFLKRALESARDSQLKESLEAFLKQLGHDTLEAKKGPLVAAFIAGFLAAKVTGR